MVTSFVIPADELWPRTPEYRYRIVARHGHVLDVLAACPEPGGIGEALVQLDADERERGRRLIDRGQIGVLDVVEGRWLLLPWTRPEREATYGHPPVPLMVALEEAAVDAEPPSGPAVSSNATRKRGR